MGKGGGGSQESESRVYQSSLPEYAEPYYKRLVSRAETESLKPYTQYEGERISGFSPDTQTSFQQVRDIASAGTPGVDQAQGIAAGVGGYQAGGIGTQRVTEAGLQQYINPYVNQVLDQAQARATRRYDEQQVARDLRAGTTGAFGGSRGAVESGLARRDLNEQLSGLEAQELSNAYNQALGAFQSDEARVLQAQIANEQARQGAAGLQLQGAEQMGGLDELRQKLQLQQADALGRVGTQQQQQEQARLDLAQQDFTNQRDYPRQQLAFLSQILQGMPVTPQQEVTSYSPTPNPYSQALGLGATGYGLQQLFSQQGAS